MKELDDLTPAEWRALLCEAALSRCIACGEFDACDCSETIDEAKSLIIQVAAT